jgi:hypothetical protein
MWAVLYGLKSLNSDRKKYDLVHFYNKFKNIFWRLLLTGVFVSLRFIAFIVSAIILGMVFSLSRSIELITVFNITIGVIGFYLVIIYSFVIFLLDKEDIKTYKIPTVSGLIAKNFTWKIARIYLFLWFLMAVFLTIYYFLSNVNISFNSIWAGPFNQSAILFIFLQILFVSILISILQIFFTNIIYQVKSSTDQGHLLVELNCPSCSKELELDDSERKNRIFYCPFCAKVINYNH